MLKKLKRLKQQKRGRRSSSEDESERRRKHRGRSRSRSSGRDRVARLPPLSREQFWWDGEPAMIQKWRKTFVGYSPQE